MTSKEKTTSLENLSKIIKRLIEENKYLKQAVGLMPILNLKDLLKILALLLFKGK